MAKVFFENIFFLIFIVCIQNLCFGQRPMTDSVITHMISEMQKGNCDEALKLADKGYEFSLIEEPQNADMWKAHFGLRKAQILLQIKGDIEGGEKLLNELTKKEGTHNKQALFWWLQLTNVKGKLHLDLGDFETAKELYKKAYYANKSDFRSEKNYYDYLTTLFIKSNELDSANFYCEKLISITRLNGDTLNNRYYGHLLSYAYILSKLGDNEKSNKLLKFIQEKSSGFRNKNNYNTRIHFLSKMITIKGNLNDYNTALQYAKESEQIFVKSLGKNNYEYYISLFEIGSCFYKLGEKDSAYKYFNKIPEILERNISKKTHLLSIRGKEIFINQNKAVRNNLLYMLEYFDNHFPDYNTKIYDYILFQKKNTTQSIERLKKFYLTADTPWKQEFDFWKQKRSAYFDRLIFNKYNEDTTRVLAKELELQEKKLFSYAGLEYFSNQKKISWKDIADKLDSKSIAIEFIRYNNIKTKKKTYGALLISSKYKDPIFIRLCEESKLKAMLSYEFAETDYEFSERIYKSKSLYNLIWKPLEVHIKDAKNCYISLSGLLYKIALDAILYNNSKIESNIHLLHTTASLTKPENIISKNPTAVLCGGINYDLSKNEINDSITSEISINVHSFHRGLNQYHWYFLKETHNEVNEIKFLLQDKGYKINLHTGKSCSEGMIKTELKNNTPNILHIATHGYYPVVNDSVLSFTQTASYARSGLVMAGANSCKSLNKTIDNFGDGILSAPEITSLNLSNTNLVVLSACESGKGKISHIDELYGLQRAFKIAGAKSIIYTLWKIPDESTKKFMVFFYNKLSEGNTIKESFFLSKNYMKKNYPAYYWGGFQLIE